MVVCLVKQLEGVLGPGNIAGRCCVITPYREQRSMLLKAFALVFDGEGAASRLGVQVSTIDGFQGQESDVIIVSTVRGGGNSGGVGFLADVRRMNVALTRAKRSLWVVGQVDALRRSEMWRQLVGPLTTFTTF